MNRHLIEHPYLGGAEAAERGRRAQEREERLQRSIQGTLMNLSKKVDKKIKQSGAAGDDRPTGFWAASRARPSSDKRAGAGNSGEGSQQESQTMFSELEFFLGRKPDEQQLTPGAVLGSNSGPIT